MGSKIYRTCSSCGATAYVTHPPCCNCAGALILGVVAFCGFWMIKGAALEAAREAARLEINNKAPEMFYEAAKLNGGGNQQSMVNFFEVDSEDIIGQATEVERD